MNDNYKIIRDIIRKESLRIIKESQASFLKESLDTIDDDIKLSMKRVNDYIGLLEKNIDKLNGEEKSAMEKEDYISLKDVKKSQLSELTAMIKAYEKKLQLLNKQKTELELEFSNVNMKGSDVFKNQEIIEFSADNFKKGWGLKIETDNYFIDLVKQMDETNNFKIINTNIPGLQQGYVTAVPMLKIGGEGKLNIYKHIGGNKYDEIEKPLIIKNIRKMYKNPK